MPVVAVVHAPASGHIRPLLPLVAALSDRGSEVVQFAPPEWEAECLAAGGGFRAAPDIGIEVTEPPANPIAVAELLAKGAELGTPWLIEQLREIGAEIVLRDVFVGRYAALQARVPQVAFSPMMAVHRSIRPSLRSAPVAMGVLAAGMPSALRLRHISRRMEQLYGAPLGSWLDVLAGRYGYTTLIGTSRALQVRPDGLAGEDVRFVGPLRAASTTASRQEPALVGVREDEELVYVSLGTMFESRPEFFRDAAHALARPGRRIVLSVGRISPQALGELPAGVTAHSHVDQLAVLARSSVFITHGGFNGVQEALIAGVPMLLFPQMQEQALNTARVCELGAGLRLRRATTSQITVKTDLILTDPRFRDAAVRAGTELRGAVDLDGAVAAVLGARQASLEPALNTKRKGRG
jgi:MGT family glycosyltransferase